MFYRGKIASLLLAGTILMVPGKLYSVPYELSYGGRLVENNGKPVGGPVDIRVKFYRSATGTDEIIAVTVPDFTNVTLTTGMFQVVMNLTATEFHIIFNESESVWIQITDLTHSRTYPRQKFSVVPYALKVPVDGEAINYNVDGELTLGQPNKISLKAINTDYAVSLKSPDDQAANFTLTLPGDAGAAGQFLKSDGTGNMIWDTISGGYPASDATKVGYLSVTGATNLDQIRSDVTANNAKNSYPSGDSTKVSYLTVTAATNLDTIRTTVSGLGDAASKNVGTLAGTVAAGDHSHVNATTAVAGLMSAADKTKLDGIATGAEVDSNAKTLCADGEFLRGEETTTCRTSAEILYDGGGITTSDTGTVTSTMIANGTIADADISGTAAIAGTKIDPDFGSQDIFTTGTISGNGSGITNLPGGPTSCPAGFSMVGTSGSIGTFCIDTNQRAAKTFLAAQDECMDLSLSGKEAFLCGFVEWYKACRKAASASPSLVGMTGDYERVAEIDGISQALSVGQSTCSSIVSNTLGTPYPFRCCVR